MQADRTNFPVSGMATHKQRFHRGRQTKWVTSDGVVNAECEARV